MDCTNATVAGDFKYSFIENEWYTCPECRRVYSRETKLFKIKKRSNEATIEIKCRRCGKILDVRI